MADLRRGFALLKHSLPVHPDLSGTHGPDWLPKRSCVLISGVEKVPVDSIPLVHEPFVMVVTFKGTVGWIRKTRLTGEQR